MNVIDLQSRRQHQNQDGNEQNILDAMWYGIEHSIHSKDPNNPDAPPTPARFMAKCADENPLFFMRLLLARYATDF